MRQPPHHPYTRSLQSTPNAFSPVTSADTFIGDTAGSVQRTAAKLVPPRGTADTYVLGFGRAGGPLVHELSCVEDSTTTAAANAEMLQLKATLHRRHPSTVARRRHPRDLTESGP
ncbi:hypothetical protein SKAU_G00187910 [Synaphobranchus kaupii]|uniref:Uncharacterized protein n=1 Tax=Synaphobranchus kaupii TaxID=118154 RepID=A0A9Q1FD38_SYNKA|nr:hypothetical protein SKAU_G00187910 [Synaphobranchus kaupii]